MKKVFSTTAEVCRIWAMQSQPEARTGSNTSFRDTTLYSYGTPIAHLCLGRDVALISSNHWSSDTSTVQGQAAEAAANRSWKVFRVPVIDCTVAGVASNLAWFEENIRKILDGIERSPSPGSRRRTAKAQIIMATSYAKAMNTAWSYTGPDPDSVLSKKECG